jgi:hypothetical protein
MNRIIGGLSVLFFLTPAQVTRLTRPSRSRNTGAMTSPLRERPGVCPHLRRHTRYFHGARWRGDAPSVEIHAAGVRCSDSGIGDHDSQR